MANIFLDTNIFFDVTTRNIKKAVMLETHKVFISPLSYHIYCYSQHVVQPDKILSSFLENFEMVSFSKKLLKKSMIGPTIDLEDNVQLQSGVDAHCDYFLTSDKELLKMERFGKMKIVDSLPSSPL